MNSRLQIQLIDGGQIALLLVCAPLEPQMYSRDFRQATGEQTLGDCVADDLGAKPPTATWAALKWTEFKKTQETSVILNFAIRHHAAPLAMFQ
jgi:hypothetical protein